MGLRSGHESSKANIGNGQDDIEILVHITVMQEVVAIESAEPPRFFDAAGFWQVHAPMDVFVKAIIGRKGDGSAEDKCPLSGHP